MSSNPRQTTSEIMKEFLRHLRAGTPDAYLSFVQAFELYTIETLNALGGAPQDQILNAQGRAQQCQALLRLFQELDSKKAQPASPPATP